MIYKVVTESEDELLSQGDILRHVHVIQYSPGTEEQSLTTQTASVIVLSQGCEIDKAIKHNTTVLVALVIDLNSMPKGNQGFVRKNKVLSLFYLPQEPPFPIEGYIDFRTIQPVAANGLKVARLSDRYVCTVSNELLKAASERLWDFFFRPEPFNPR